MNGQLQCSTYKSGCAPLLAETRLPTRMVPRTGGLCIVCGSRAESCHPGWGSGFNRDIVKAAATVFHQCSLLPLPLGARSGLCSLLQLPCRYLFFPPGCRASPGAGGRWSGIPASGGACRSGRPSGLRSQWRCGGGAERGLSKNNCSKL